MPGVKGTIHFFISGPNPLVFLELKLFSTSLERPSLFPKPQCPRLMDVPSHLSAGPDSYSPVLCMGMKHQSRCPCCLWRTRRLCAWNRHCSRGCRICLNNPPGFGGWDPPASLLSWLTGPPGPPQHWRPSRSRRTPGFERAELPQWYIHGEQGSITWFKVRWNIFPCLAAQHEFAKLQSQRL